MCSQRWVFFPLRTPSGGASLVVLLGGASYASLRRPLTKGERGLLREAARYGCARSTFHFPAAYPLRGYFALLSRYGGAARGGGATPAYVGPSPRVRGASFGRLRGTVVLAALSFFPLRTPSRGRFALLSRYGGGRNHALVDGATRRRLLGPRWRGRSEATREGACARPWREPVGLCRRRRLGRLAKEERSDERGRVAPDLGGSP